MIRLLIVDSGRLMCDAMAAVVKDQPDIAVVGLATHLAAALALVPHCNLALASASLQDDGIFELIQAAGRVTPAVKVLVTGVDEDQVLRHLECGAAGYVLKEESVEDLLERLRGVYRGLPALSPRITAALMARLAELSRLSSEPGAWQRSAGAGIQALSRSGRLTSREQQVLTLLGQGLSNQEIADKLAIEIGTVKNHVHSILRKLKVSSRYQAALSLAPVTPSMAAALASPVLSIGNRLYAQVE